MAYLLDRLAVNTGQYTHYLDIYWQSNSPATNQSYLRAIQWVQRTTSPTYGAFGGAPGFAWSNNCGGSGSSGNSGAFDFTSVQDIVVDDRYLYITHNADGAKTITVSLYKGPWTAGFPEASGSKSVVLPTIPLATQPTLSASSVEIGDSVTIDLSGRASTGFDHKIEYDFGSLTAQVAGLSAHEDVETSATFTPPIELLTQMAGLSSKSGLIRVTTWNGAAQVGTAKTVAVTITPPNDSPYTQPFVTASVIRSLSDGTPDPDGTCMTVSLNAGVSSIDTGTEQNDLSYVIEARPYGSGAFVELDSDTVGALTFVDALTFVEWDTAEEFAVDSPYDVRITITDELGAPAVILRTLSPATALMDVYLPTRALSIGGVYSPTIGGGLQVWGQKALLDGDGFLPRDVIVFESNGTFEKDDYPWLRAARVRVVGGGGGGGGAASTGSDVYSVGTGGGGGGCAEAFLTDIDSLDATVAVTVGAGGSSGAGAAGGTGGSSSFGTLVVATGGTGGQVKPANVYAPYVNAGAGGLGSAGDLRIAGQGGTTAAGAGDLGSSGSGGASQLGGGAPGQGSGSSGVPGVTGGNYGGGGSGAFNSGSQSARAGGAGAPGVVIVELYG